MDNKKHYIELFYYEQKYINNHETKHFIDDKKSWFIYYEKDKNYYLCKNKHDNKITKMINVENFIKIWNYDVYNMIRKNLNNKAKISIYIENKYFSGYICDNYNYSKIPIDIIRNYTYLLKDIIEEIDENNN